MIYIVLEIGVLLIIGSSLLFVDKRRGRVAWAQYPEAPVTIESMNVYASERAKRPYVGRVTYTFLVDGQRRCGWCARSFVTEQQAWEFVGECMSRTLIARYKPENPNESLLFQGRRTARQFSR